MNLPIVEQLLDFFSSGGTILIVIFFVTFGLWTLIIERYIYLKFDFSNFSKSIVNENVQFINQSKWIKEKVFQTMESMAKEKLFKRISLIHALIALCPLLGLLGTVTGMISVFDSMAISGTGNPRLMASGISMATIPTMAGMVGSLSGIYFGKNIEKSVEARLLKFSEHLKETFQ